MNKTILSVIIAAMIFFGGAIAEQIILSDAFGKLGTELNAAYVRLKEETATAEEMEKLQNCWIEQKKRLHSFISHNDIKEFDLWISEALAYVKLGNYEEATEKIEVTIELTEQVPKGYKIFPENIF